MTLSFSAQLAARNFAVELKLDPGQRLAVLGANGAGKSTLLALIAGSLRPDRGRAELDGNLLFEIERHRSKRWLPPHARRVAMLAQDPLLFPTLSVLENVAFGPRSAGVSRAQAHLTARHWLDAVGAGELASRKPGQLSGGQAQRVAVARAVAADPRLLLLDEPLAALDVASAPRLRKVLRDVLADRSLIVVTHDLLDALLLSDQVVVMEAGRVVESGPTATVLQHPTSRFAARLAGLNLISGTAASAGILQPAHGGPDLFGIAKSQLEPGEAAVATFSPSAVSVYLQAPHGSPRNTMSVTVTELEPRGDQIWVRAETNTGESLTAAVTPSAIAELGLHPGQAASYTIKATAVAIYPA